MDNNAEMMKILLDIGCDPNYNGTSVLFYSFMDYFDYDNDDYLYDEDAYTYDKYIYDEYYDDYEEDADYLSDDSRYITGVTPLHLACYFGSIGYYKN